MIQKISQRAPMLDNSRQFEFERMYNSYENNMMSWIRTATSLITFGFSIYKFFQIDQASRPQQNRLIGPREFAFALVSIGLFSLVLATLENRQKIRTLGAQYAGKQHSLPVLVAALISILGVLALLAMIFRE